MFAIIFSVVLVYEYSVGFLEDIELLYRIDPLYIIFGLCHVYIRFNNTLLQCGVAVYNAG